MEYFWETEHLFEEFCKKIFGNAFRKKYSLTGNGIYYLVDLDNKTYELKYKETKSILAEDNHAITDKNKEYILKSIKDNLKCQSNVSGGKFISFPVNQWIAKVEIIKKLKEPT